MNVNSLHRTLLASVIGSALAFGFSAPSSAQAQEAVADQQGQDADDREARRKARQEAREEAAAQREAARAQRAEQRVEQRPQPQRSDTVDAWADNRSDQAQQQQARLQQQQAQREAELAQLRQRQAEQQTEQRQQQARQRDAQLEQARASERAREARGRQRDVEQAERQRAQQGEAEAVERQRRQAEVRDARIDDLRERQRDRNDDAVDTRGGDRSRDRRPNRGDGDVRRNDDGLVRDGDAVVGRRISAEEEAAGRQSEARDQRLNREALIVQQRRQAEQYNRELQQREALARQQYDVLQRQNRSSQYAYQQRYYDLLRQQRLRNNYRNYDYYADPYFSSAPSYRYYRNGSYYNVNRYAADLLRQAVNYGYREGIRAGRADRVDRWRYDYRSSFAYQDANYGYRGFYVTRSEYNYYFRQGFRRGYEDGYYGRRQYGRYSNGNDAILGNVLSLILNLQPYNRY